MDKPSENYPFELPEALVDEMLNQCESIGEGKKIIYNESELDEIEFNDDELMPGSEFRVEVDENGKVKHVKVAERKKGMLKEGEIGNKVNKNNEQTKHEKNNETYLNVEENKTPEKKQEHSLVKVGVLRHENKTLEAIVDEKVKKKIKEHFMFVEMNETGNFTNATVGEIIRAKINVSEEGGEENK